MTLQLIVLIGYRGAGKSTLAKKLSTRLGWDYVSSDAEIEKEVGNLSEWIPLHGWPAFRNKEYETCKTLSQRKQTVVDLGGGVVENSENLNFFKGRALILWIDTNLNTLLQRLLRDHRRPLLTDLTDLSSSQERNQTIIEETKKKYQERFPLYQNFSHHRIDNNRSTSIVVEDILTLLKEYLTMNKSKQRSSK